MVKLNQPRTIDQCLKFLRCVIKQKITLTLPFVMIANSNHAAAALVSSFSDAPISGTNLAPVAAFALGTTYNNDDQPFNHLIYSPLALGRKLHYRNVEDQRYVWACLFDLLQENQDHCLCFEDAMDRWSEVFSSFHLLNVRDEFDVWLAQRQKDILGSSVGNSSRQQNVSANRKI